MLQIVLKSYKYYSGKIDGDIGPISKNALISFQSTNNLDADGILGPKTCEKLLNKKVLIKNNDESNYKISNKSTNYTYSQEVESIQQKLKELNIYSGNIDGINGQATKRAIKDFQTKAD